MVAQETMCFHFSARKGAWRGRARECAVQGAESVCLWGELEKRLQGPKCLGVSCNPDQPRCLLIIQNPGPSPGPVKQESWRAEKTVVLTNSWPGNKQRVSC